MNSLSVVYYTSNYLQDKNPYFFENTKKQLIKSAKDLEIITVSQRPLDFGTNICVGNIGRSHLNIYKQILIGAKKATTDYVAMAEDDILYAPEHFNPFVYIKPEHINNDTLLYDMNKVSLFTWTKPPMFSFRTNRRVVNQLIAPRKILIELLEERFARVEVLKKKMPMETIIKYWGDPSRYENLLGVKERKAHEYYCKEPSVVFSHEYAYGYEFNQGKKKKLGDLRIIELQTWGRAEDILKLYER